MATVINRATYFNIGGGRKQCSSLYMNSGGSRKTITSAYGNVGGSRKQIYPYSATTSTTYYYWDRYELVTTGSVSTTSTGSYYIPISYGNFSLLYAYNSSYVGKDRGRTKFIIWKNLCKRHI